MIYYSSLINFILISYCIKIDVIRIHSLIINQVVWNKMWLDKG